MTAKGLLPLIKIGNSLNDNRVTDIQLRFGNVVTNLCGHAERFKGCFFYILPETGRSTLV